MNSVADDPKTNTYQGPLGSPVEMKCFILEQAQRFIDKYICIDVAPLPSYGPQCNCWKVYKQTLGLRKHEHKVHGQEDPRYAETSETLVQSDSSSEDMVLNYTKHALTLCLLRANHDDAITMGDGDRMMLVNLYLYLLYKVCKCPKYAYGLLETMCQSKILLTERMAHRLTWNRTVNNRGKMNSNHPSDLDLEHCNRVFKDEAHSFRGVFTNKTLARVSRSALCTDQIAKNYDKQTNTKKASGIHTDKDITEDVMLIVNQLKQQNVFDNIPGRHHQSFPAIEANPWSKLDMENVRDWISQSLHKFSSKHFY